MASLDEALDALRAECERGAPPDAGSFCARYPELGAELCEAVDDYLFMLGGLAKETPASVAGTTLGDFRLVKEIGRGGMGVVYEAEQVSLRRTVALKVLPAHVTLRSDAVERFRREASTAGRLRHPGIVEVYLVGEAGGVHFFAMELVEGVSLEALLARERGAPPQIERAARLALQVAEALSYAHRHGVIHRDVKPSNILVRPDGEALLTDFGLAREADLDSLTEPGTFAGTLPYLSPERATGGRPVDGRSDLFSLGVTLFECLTRSRPFEGATPHELMARIARDEAPSARSRNPRVPRDLATIVSKALEKEPADRYASADAMASDLRAFLELRPISASPVSTATRVLRWTRREPAKAGLVGSLALIAAAALVTAGYVAPKLRESWAAESLAEAEDLTTEGILAMQQHDAKRANELLDRVLRGPFPLPEARVGKALTLFFTEGKKDEAMRFLETEPEDPHDARALKRLRAGFFREIGRPADAEPIERILGPPESALDFLVETMCVGSGQQARALAFIRKAHLALPRARPTYHLVLVRAASDAREREAAIAAADAAEKLWPGSAAVALFCAEILSATAPERAASSARRYIELRPRDWQGPFRLGTALLHARKLDESRESLERAIALDPSVSPPHHNLAFVLAQLGRVDDALAEYRLSIEVNPAAWDSWRDLGYVLMEKKKEYAAAEEPLRRACELAPDEAEPHRYLTRLLLQNLNRPADAVPFARRLFELRPSDAAAAHQLGVALWKSGDREGCLEPLVLATELAPSAGGAHLDLGAVRLERDDLAGAEASLRRASELEPRNARAHELLLKTLAAAGDEDGARAERERFASAASAPTR